MLSICVHKPLAMLRCAYDIFGVQLLAQTILRLDKIHWSSLNVKVASVNGESR